MPTRAVLFDLDETLVVDGAATQAALRAATAFAAAYAAQRQIWTPEAAPDPEALARAAWLRALDGWEHALHRDYLQTFGVSAGECLWGRFIGEDARLRPIARWAVDFQFQTWLRALGDLGQPDTPKTEALAALLAERFRMERRARRDWLFPEARATLDALQASYALALITNGAPDIQRDKLVGSGLEPYFPVVVVSCEAGVAKPDPAIFAQALDALEVAPSDAVMVGDSARHDILGANRAGVRAIWLRRADGQGQPLGPGAHPDATIASLAELPALL